MRRWMRSLVVALLCLTLCVDTARACWWRRHRTRPGVPAVRYQPLDAPVYCVPAEDTAGFRVDEVLIREVLIDDHDGSTTVTDVVESEMAMSTMIDSLPVHEQVEPPVEPTVVADETAGTQALELPGAPPDTVVVHAPTLVVDASPAVPTAAPTADSVDTATMSEQPTTTPLALEPNLFDRYDNDAGSADDDAAEETPAEEPAAEAVPEAAFLVPDEPIRRWTNAAGTHHAQGWLVELHADRVRILKVNGRHTTMKRESLSEDDRAYVSAVGGRLAAARQDTRTVGL